MNFKEFLTKDTITESTKGRRYGSPQSIVMLNFQREVGQPIYINNDYEKDEDMIIVSVSRAQTDEMYVHCANMSSKGEFVLFTRTQRIWIPIRAGKDLVKKHL